MSCQDVSDGDVMKPYILVYRYRVVFDQQHRAYLGYLGPFEWCVP